MMQPAQEQPAISPPGTRTPLVPPEGTIRRLLRRGQTPGDHGIVPWTFLIVAAAATLIQFAGTINPAWTSAMIYDRTALTAGQVWRLWTGHLVHYGWLHFTVDTAILLYLGRVITWPRPGARWLALFVLPPVISAAIYFFDSSMTYYAGLSALNLGLFVFHAIQGWRRDRTDWLWPAVLLVCGVEIAYETVRGGSGGGLIAFSDPSVRIATSAHIAGGAGGLVLWLLARKYPGPDQCGRLT